MIGFSPKRSWFVVVMLSVWPFSIAGAQPIHKNTPSATEGYLPGYFAMGAQDYQSAAGFFQMLLKQHPGDTAVQRQLFLALCQIGQIKEAGALVESLRKENIDFPLLHLVAGVSSLTHDSKKEGISTAEAEFKALQNQKDDFFKTFSIFLQLWTGVMTSTQTSPLVIDLAWAEQKLQSLRDRQGLAEMYWLNLGILAELAGKSERADYFYKKLWQATPNPSLRTLEIVGIFYARYTPTATNPVVLKLQQQLTVLGRDPKILNLINILNTPELLPPQAINSAEQGIAELFFNFAGMLSQQQEGELAVPIYELALELRPDLSQARLALASTLQQMGRFDEALAQYRQIGETSYFSPLAQFQVAMIFSGQNKPEEALTQLRQLSAVYPEWIAPYNLMADLLRGQKRFAEAIPFYDHALKLTEKLMLQNPNSIEIKKALAGLYFSRGIAYASSKQLALGEADFQKSIDLVPNIAPVLNYLAYSWADQGIKLDQALQMLRKADQLEPGQGYILDSIGWAYYRLKQYDQAVAYLERAIVLEPMEAEINDHLGDIYWVINRKREALFQWQRALRLNPEPETIPLIQQKIQQGLPK